MNMVSLFKFIALIGVIVFVSFHVGASTLDNEQGLNIVVEKSQESADVIIDVEFSIFVNCGGQYAVWHQFENATLFTVKDLDTGVTYKSIDGSISISLNGNEVYDHYSKEPCDRVVTNRFSVPLSDIHFINASEKPITNMEISAFYFGYESNVSVIKNTSILLKSW